MIEEKTLNPKKDKPNTMRRWREVRDVYQNLRKSYRSDVAMDFVQRNYFMEPSVVYNVLQMVDKLEVTDPSIIYTTVMSPDFKL